ncbi:hypothetical protein K4K49_009688 [Colletotrichum sp. SAR 10_70]|nr:hypothetical protein K4K50_009687 [Colletotrichum sp. SAR 10_71]KAI8154396.1 hypothetical protein K4K49_009688 [Colletotrichum sp. SAR 10_70]KAI8197986.1 hypothetical protein K4K52_010049 [Colletotrichum sp. SAR 10_76]
MQTSQDTIKDTGKYLRNAYVSLRIRKTLRYMRILSAPLKRNDTVLDLLRCIPYIDSPSNSLALAPFLMQDIPVIYYRNEDLQKKIREDCIEGLVMPITGQDPLLPPSCALITICRSRSGYDVILDTADD